MKKCQKCGKPSESLTITLAHGPNGYRRYALCPNCLKVPKAKKVIQNKKETKREQ